MKYEINQIELTQIGFMNLSMIAPHYVINIKTYESPSKFRLTR
jgi:hypothetical protein